MDKKKIIKKNSYYIVPGFSFTWYVLYKAYYLYMCFKPNLYGTLCALLIIYFRTLDKFYEYKRNVQYQYNNKQTFCTTEVPLLSKQLEWYSMKNFVLDLVLRVATQFINLIAPWDSFIGSEMTKKKKKRQNSASSKLERTKRQNTVALLKVGWLVCSI